MLDAAPALLAAARPCRLPDIIEVARPEGLPYRIGEYIFINYRDGTQAAGYSYWVVNSTIHMIVREIEDAPTARWACERFNELAQTRGNLRPEAMIEAALDGIDASCADLAGRQLRAALKAARS